MVGDDVMIRQAIQQRERVADGHRDFCSGRSELRSKLKLSESLRLSHAVWVVMKRKAFTWYLYPADDAGVLYE